MLSCICCSQVAYSSSVRKHRVLSALFSDRSLVLWRNTSAIYFNMDSASTVPLLHLLQTVSPNNEPNPKTIQSQACFPNLEGSYIP